MPAILQEGGRLDLFPTQGVTLTKEFQWTAPDGSPRSTSGYVGRLQVRRQAEDETAYLSVSSDDVDPGVILQPGNQIGLIRVLLSPARTRLLLKPGWYQLEMVSQVDSSDVVLISWGLVWPSREVTR